MFDFILKFPIWLQVVCYIALFILGIYFLVHFCDIFVENASKIATVLKISPMIIGLTIVAMGTSCPELAVSVSDSISTLISGGNANIAIGNVVGSNICNLLLVLGFSSLFTPIFVDKSVCKKEFPFLILVSSFCVVFGIFFGMGTIVGNYAILRWEAIIFVIALIFYIWFIVREQKSKNKQVEPQKTEVETEKINLFKTIVLLLVGLAGIVIGGEIVVVGAKGISLIGTDALNINHDLAESLVGLTIVAVGTSLPELVTSIIASKKGENDIALGNVIGSNIFNILFVLGISGTINPLTSGSQVVFDLCVMFFVTILAFLIARKGKFNEKHGYLFIVLYCLYLSYLILRTVL